MSNTTSLLLNKQPILNQDNTIYGYHLSVDLLGKTELSVADYQDSLDTLYADIESAGGLNLITQNRPVFFKLPLSHFSLASLPKIEEDAQFIVEIDCNITKDKAALTELKSIVNAGHKVALTPTNTEADSKLLGFAKYVKVSAQSYSPEEVAKMLPALEGKTVILTDVESDETYAKYKDLNLSHYQGFFYTEPVIAAENVPDNNALVLLKLLAEVNDPEVEFEDIVNTVKTDPILSHKLISAINHPSNNLPHMVDNLKDAVSFMGLKRLKFWVNLLVMSQIGDIPKELLITALVRAKFLEALAESVGKNTDKDRYFMVGLFSTLNAFMKISMQDIVGKLPISDEVKLALLDQTGSMGKALFIVKSLEQGNTQVISMGYEGLGLMEVSSDYMKANGWAYQTIASLDAA